MLANKTAVVYGGGGVLGGAIARAMHGAGARVFLAGRTRGKLDALAKEIAADAAEVDALDEAALGRHTADVAARAGGIDVVVNAVGVRHVQGVPLAELSLEDFFHPVAAYTKSAFLVAKAAAQHMRAGGAILLLSTPASRMPGPGYLGHSVACAGVEALTRHLAGELGARGIRVVCIRSHAVPETVAAGSHAREVFGEVAARAGSTVDAMLAGAATATLLGRLPTLDEVARTAVFLASDGAGASTGVIANLTCGFLLD